MMLGLIWHFPLKPTILLTRNDCFDCLDFILVFMFLLMV